MRVMVIVKATRNSEAGVMPGETLLADMGRYNEDLVKAGVMQDAAGLKPSKFGKRVRFSAGQKSVIDGPFPATQELVRRCLRAWVSLRAASRPWRCSAAHRPRWSVTRSTASATPTNNREQVERTI